MPNPSINRRFSRPATINGTVSAPYARPVKPNVRNHEFFVQRGKAHLHFIGQIRQVALEKILSVSTDTADRHARGTLRNLDRLEALLEPGPQEAETGDFFNFQ